MQILHIFRRDLRLRDNAAFDAAVRASNGDVLPVFVFDDALLRGDGVSRARARCAPRPCAARRRRARRSIQRPGRL